MAVLSATLAPTLLPCRGITLTVGPASNNKSHKNGAFCIAFDLGPVRPVPLCADQFETSTSPPGHTPGI